MFNLFEDINTGVKEYKASPGAVLIDVREVDEYNSGHIPEAVNIPLSSIEQISLPKSAPLFVYCLRGSRSKKVVEYLTSIGYTQARSIGGIKGYKGELKECLTSSISEIF